MLVLCVGAVAERAEAVQRGRERADQVRVGSAPD
jgi:hypothetical protein